LTGTVLNAPDGTVGTPYVLARGVEVISDNALWPENAINPVGTEHTVIAVVTSDDPALGTPVVGTLVTFEVVVGPRVGLSDTDTTNAAGEATFTYLGGAIRIDTIETTFVDELGRSQRSNRVTKEWVEKGPEPDVDKWWSRADVCVGQDIDGDGSLSEDPADFGSAGVPIDNDVDGLFNEGASECDPVSHGTPLDTSGDTHTVNAVGGKNGNVKSYNPGEAYAVTKIEVPVDGILTIHEEYGACSAELLKLSPKNGGPRLVIVSERDGTLEQVLDAKVLEAATWTVRPGGAWFDLDVAVGDVLYARAKFRPTDADIGASCATPQRRSSTVARPRTALIWR
jgi:hypothetical protein